MEWWRDDVLNQHSGVKIASTLIATLQLDHTQDVGCLSDDRAFQS